MTDRLEPGTGSQAGAGAGPRGSPPDPEAGAAPDEAPAAPGVGRGEEDRLDRAENLRRSRVRRVGTDTGLIALYALLTIALALLIWWGIR